MTLVQGHGKGKPIFILKVKQQTNIKEVKLKGKFMKGTFKFYIHTWAIKIKLKELEG